MNQTGLFLFVNQILHAFGWCIVFEVDENNEVTSVYPARTKFRGFSNDIQTRSYQKISKYLKDNVDDLVEEANN